MARSHSSLATETHLGNTKGNMHRGYPLASSAFTAPGVASFSVKSSENFYGQPSWTNSESWSIKNSPASFDTVNASRSHLPKKPSSASQKSSTESGNSEQLMIDSSKTCSQSSKETTLPFPDGGLGTEKGKEKKTKLGKMCKGASRSTKAISRLFFHSPRSGRVAKRSSLKLPLPFVVPPEEEHVVDPFASGNSVASYGLSPVEPRSSMNHQRTHSFPVAESSLAVDTVNSSLLRPPSISFPGISDSPSSGKSNQQLEGQSKRGRKVSFPSRVCDLSSTSWSPPVQRPRANSVSTTRKVFHDENPPPIPQISRATTAPRPPVPDHVLAQISPSVPHIPLHKSITRQRTKSLSQTSFKEDTRSSSINGRMRPLPPIPNRADRAPAVQTQAQLHSDVNPNMDMKHGSKTLVIASSPSMPSLKAGYIASPRDASVGISGQRRQAGSIAKHRGPVHEPQNYSKPERLPRAHVPTSRSVPPVASSGISECISRRRGSNSSGDASPSPSFQQHQSIKPILPPLLTQHLSTPANPSDSKSVSGSPGSLQCRLPRSPSLPELRHGSADARPVPQLRPNSHSNELRGLPRSVHVRFPSLPTLSRDSGNMPRPQALPIWIVDRLKSRGRDFSRPTSRLSSTDSASSTKSPSLISEKATASGSNTLTYSLTHASNYSVKRDSGSETHSCALHCEPLSVAHERKPTPEAITSTSRNSNSHVFVHPSVPSIKSSALKGQSPHSPTTSLLQKRRCLRSPSMPDLRARVTASSVASSDGRSQPSFSPIPHQIRHAPSHSHSQSILAPPIPPIPDNYKLQTAMSPKPDTAPPFDTTFRRPRPNRTRPNEFSYPPTKKAGKPFHMYSNKELEQEDNMVSMGTPPRYPRTLSMMIPSSPEFHRRRMSNGSKSISAKGQGEDIPPVPPLPSSTPMPALIAPRIRNVPLHDKFTVGAAF
ncbi:hypothetical protein AGABI2DRAFT_122911 [Agaricus bisporus var. bisporus H97]|uniref:hypothetical protein n=1 Tax=Agaricus bisporus var. bisporus (strain H97 / ATCC MYA-4626 / FGSC 10389) TaxID=936046 RepID=UPI00029F7778|nr:hypothetical protein AGABI2DRAFT_122911 [Agaricus bisporus var. bisporus H97]EKV42181.1 hypothetical protein AGABI2DRAFT_122911 [Agaricus bisporus var. bisporus H97]